MNRRDALFGLVFFALLVAPGDDAVALRRRRASRNSTSPTIRTRGRSSPYDAYSAPAARSSGSAYYPNCASARAAGAAPIRVGEPGYSRRLDRDGDGVACE